MNQRFREASSPDLCGSKAWLSSALNTNVNIGPLLRSGHSQHPASSHCHCSPEPPHQALLGLSTSTHAPLSLPYPSHSILYIASEWSFKTVITSPLCLEPSNGFFFCNCNNIHSSNQSLQGLCALAPAYLSDSFPALPCPSFTVQQFPWPFCLSLQSPYWFLPQSFLCLSCSCPILWYDGPSHRSGLI